MKKTILTTVTTLGIAVSASAATVSIDVGNNADISGAELVGLPSIAQAADDWINATSSFHGNSGTNGSGDNVTGITVGSMTISWDGNYYGEASNGASNQNHLMMDGMMAMNVIGTTYVSITGLGSEFTSSGYDVYVYIASDTSRSHGLAGNDGTTTVQAVGATTNVGQFLTDSGNYETTPSYVKLSGFTGSDFTLTRGSGGGVPQISGLQIVSVPEPSSAALIGLGGIALILRRRK